MALQALDKLTDYQDLVTVCNNARCHSKLEPIHEEELL